MAHALKEDMARLREQLKIISAHQQRQQAAVEELTAAVRELTDKIGTLGNRTEFAAVLRGLKARGIITQADIDRISGLGCEDDRGVQP